MTETCFFEDKQKLHFVWIYFRLFEKSPRYVEKKKYQKKGTKSQKKWYTGVIYFLKSFQYIGVISNNKTKKLKKLNFSTFFRFFPIYRRYFFLDFFCRHTRLILQTKRKKSQQKWSFFSSSRGSSSKKQVSVIYEKLIYPHENEKKQ